MVFTTKQHDKGTSQELSHSMQWGFNLGWGDVCGGCDTALLCLIKMNSGGIKNKTKPKNFHLKRGRNKADKRYEFFLQDRLLNRLFLFTEVQ